MQKLKLTALACAMLAFGSAPALAAPGDVLASNPASVVQAMRDLGYEPKLGKDSGGDPQIDAKMAGYAVTVYFYGCTNNRNCDSLQFRAGFDSKSMFTPQQAVEFTKKYRYGAVFLDNEKDPWLNWDVMVGPGISRTTFKLACEAYEATLQDLADVVFDDD